MTAGIADAAKRLAAGGLVAFPTETVYGLGADATSAQAVAEVYRTKGRPAGHPLIVHVLDEAQARWWAELGRDAKRLIDAFWPGPLTLIVPRRPGAPAFACGDEPTIGLRSPAHPVARALLEAFTALGGHGIAAPSANRFGRVSPTEAAHVRADLGEARLLILDGGPCEVGLESTIVDLSR
ncbi:MAG TPA: L-threonylcarbamoyladenylate synthase, partial [Burkholderiaceae bacterium]